MQFQHKKRSTFRLSSGMLCVLVALGLYGATGVQAEDIDIYFSNPNALANARPNVLIILDTSGSMGPMNGNVGTTGMTRLDNMKVAVKNFLDSPEAGGINVGLMRFSSDPGGPVLFPVTDINASASSVDNSVYVQGGGAADDAEEDVGSTAVTINSTSLEMVDPGSPQLIGLRFQSVGIPQGATITGAKLRFTAQADETGAASYTIAAQAADDAPAFTTANADISSRALTTASVSWAPADWTSGQTYDSPDLSAVVQEVVNRSGWCGNHDMAFVITGTGLRTAQARDAGTTGAPILLVSYDTSAIPAGGGCVERSIQIPITADADDAEQRDSSMRLGDNTIQLVKDSGKNQQVGFRFRNVAVPQGAKIVSAEIEFTIKNQKTTSTSLTVQADASDSSPAFSNNNNNISNRTKTSASVTWSSVPAPADKEKLVSPDISSVIQEVVNRAGWASGNNLSVIITGSGVREVYSHDDAPSRAAVLRVTFESTASDQTVREYLKSIVDQFTAAGSTPIVDTLYEAALYFRGEAVTYGKQRGPGSSNKSYARVTRVSHPASYTGGTVSRDAGCTDADLNAVECATETITGSPVYISPMTAGCQENHIILLTDGDPTVNNSVSEIQSMTGKTCATTSPSAAKCSNELANFLSTVDQSGLADKQVVKVHTIGFNNDGDPDYLKALAQAGGGGYYTASTASDLATVLQTITRSVLDAPTSFVSPSLSVNAFNRLFHRDEVYFSLFKPTLTAFWPGNVKKYTLCKGGAADNCNAAQIGSVIDVNKNFAIGTDPTDPATYSKILSTAKSYWSSVVDGPEVEKGGAGSNTPAHGSRKVYTYTDAADFPASPVNLATDSAHHVLTTNTTLRGMLGISGTTTADEDRKTAIIEWMRGKDVLDENNDGDTTDNRWAFADALHSRPATVTYGGTEANPVIKLFVGTNDGALRMINATTGVEEWIVYFPEFLDKQGTLMDDPTVSIENRIYGVDGSPSIYAIDNDGDGKIEPADGDKVYLYIGMRRGGRDIYAFDVTPSSELTNPSSTGGVQPKFMWRIKGGTGDYQRLGQTWSRPRVTNIRVKCNGAACSDGDSTTEDSQVKTVLILAGGYDPTTLDSETAMPSSGDSMGNAIYIVDPLTGGRIWWASAPVASCSGRTCPDLELSNMKYAIASDIAMLDTNGDRETDRLYVGDTRGQLWRVDLHDQLDPGGSTTTARNGGTTAYVFADIGCSGGSRSDDCSTSAISARRKFFYPPSVAPVNDPDFSENANYDLVTIGTGDREDPLDKISKNNSVDAVHNRLYAFRDYNYTTGTPKGADGNPLTPAALTDTDLYDATDNDLTTLSGTALDSVKKNKKGWYIELRESSSPQWIGEKMLSETNIFDHVIYATTYIPSSSSGSCDSIAEGTAKGYKIAYLTGAAVEDFDNDGDTERSTTLGGGIPAEYVIVIREEGVSSLVGTSGGGKASVEDTSLPRYTTYWYDE